MRSRETSFAPSLYRVSTDTLIPSLYPLLFNSKNFSFSSNILVTTMLCCHDNVGLRECVQSFMITHMQCFLLIVKG